MAQPYLPMLPEVIVDEISAKGISGVYTARFNLDNDLAAVNAARRKGKGDLVVLFEAQAGAGV